MDDTIKMMLSIDRRQRVKVLLNYLNIKQNAISESYGISKPFVSMVVNGKERSRDLEEFITTLVRKKAKRWVSHKMLFG